MTELLRQIRIMLTPGDKWRMVGLTALMVAGGLLEIVGITILMPVVAVLTKPEMLEQNQWLASFARIVNLWAPGRFLPALCLLVIVFYLAKNLFLLALTYWQARFVYGKACDWAVRLYDNYLKTAYSFHLRHNSSELLNNVNLLSNVTTGVLMPTMMLFSEAIVIAAIVGMLLVFIPVATLCAFAVSAILAAALYYPFRRHNIHMGKLLVDSCQKVFWCLMQGIGGIKEVKLYNQEEHFSGLYADSQRLRYRTEMLLYFFGQFPRLTLEALVVVLAMAMLMVLSLAEVASGAILLTVSLLAMSMFRLLPAISRIQYNLVRIRQAQCSFDTVFHDLTQLSHEKKISEAAPLCFRQALTIQHLTFGYDPQRPVLLDFNTEIAYRSSVAFVGTTGCGKSTLAMLILGLLKPDSGTIRVDGRDIQENLASWQSLIGYVPQTIFLLDSSIRINIAFGVSEAQIDDRRIEKCLEMAQLKTFIESLPDGLDTSVGELGVRLSGGQRQRIGIARALYRNPEVLILDEATSALDADTELALIEALDFLKGKLTLLTIAHRQTTIAQCDRMIRL